MTEWRTDDELYEVADRLGHKVIDMYTKAGVFIPQGKDRNAVLDNFRLDAETYTSLDPQKIVDEFQRMQRAARDTGEDAVAKSLLDAANNKLTTIWHGAAAEAFGHQMSYIETFTQQQEAQILFAAHSMGTAYSLAVHARRSYLALAEAAIAACEKEMQEQAERDSNAVIAMLGEVAKGLVSGWVKPETGSEMVRWGLETFIDIGAKTREVLVEGSKAEEVLGSYNHTQQELMHSLEDGLTILTKWINTEDGELGNDKIPLFDPLPMCTDVTSPDFSYGKFFHQDRNPASFNPRVDQERKKLQDERARPAGLIGMRLDGGR